MQNIWKSRKITLLIWFLEHGNFHHLFLLLCVSMSYNDYKTNKLGFSAACILQLPNDSYSCTLRIFEDLRDQTTNISHQIVMCRTRRRYKAKIKFWVNKVAIYGRLSFPKDATLLHFLPLCKWYGIASVMGAPHQITPRFAGYWVFNNSLIPEVHA